MCMHVYMYVSTICMFVACEGQNRVFESHLGGQTWQQAPTRLAILPAYEHFYPHPLLWMDSPGYSTSPLV